MIKRTFKNMREKMKNKQGFTLVELIVVIVIILILAAVLVPSVLKYVQKASQANCKQDAASTLTQLQADVADWYSDETKTDVFEPKKIGQAVHVANKQTGDPGANKYSCAFETKGENLGQITAFSYGNSRYYITWTSEGGWGTPARR
ncbi:MAG: prepilin-type N-terminal cleavage/methylation domain-containing protein [Hespellia sp.]|nr:prepilin-type N-terminal cleavage/methylation domain-containing protein [Hespellia sp.]